MRRVGDTKPSFVATGGGEWREELRGLHEQLRRSTGRSNKNLRRRLKHKIATLEERLEALLPLAPDKLSGAASVATAPAIKAHVPPSASAATVESYLSAVCPGLPGIDASTAPPSATKRDRRAFETLD